MTRKPGAPRRRQDKESLVAELRCWRRVFMCGNDWLGDLRALGCGLERRGPHKRADPVDVEDAEFMEAARDAWARLGRLWFDSGSPAARRAPWAAQAFGAAAGLTLADHGIESDGDAEDDETAAEMHR